MLQILLKQTKFFNKVSFDEKYKKLFDSIYFETYSDALNSIKEQFNNINFSYAKGWLVKKKLRDIRWYNNNMINKDVIDKSIMKKFIKHYKLINPVIIVDEMLRCFLGDDYNSHKR